MRRNLPVFRDAQRLSLHVVLQILSPPRLSAGAADGDLVELVRSLLVESFVRALLVEACTKRIGTNKDAWRTSSPVEMPSRA